MGKNVTFYIHADNLKDLEQVENKGGLLNDILRAYFDAVHDMEDDDDDIQG